MATETDSIAGLQAPYEGLLHVGEEAFGPGQRDGHRAKLADELPPMLDGDAAAALVSLDELVAACWLSMMIIIPLGWSECGEPIAALNYTTSDSFDKLSSDEQTPVGIGKR